MQNIEAKAGNPVIHAVKANMESEHTDADLRRIVLDTLADANDAAPLTDLRRLVRDETGEEVRDINKVIDELQARGEIYLVNGTVKTP